MSTENQQPEPVEVEQPAPAPAQDDNDFPLGQACDLSDDGTCEACQ